MESNPKVNFRYFVAPETAILPIYKFLDFSISTTEPVFKRGKIDMKNAIDMGPGKSFDKVRNRTGKGLPRPTGQPTTQTVII